MGRGLSSALLAMALCANAAAAEKIESHPEREAYFGETHVHTSWSFDAYIFGNHITGPAEAYKYAKGETIKHPLGYDIKIEKPLDWMGVTDHSEYAGTVRLANDPSSPISKLPIAKELVVRKPEDIQRIYLWLGTSMIRMDADQGPGRSEGLRHRLESQQRGRQRRERTRQVHRILCLRMDLDTALFEHAP